MSVIRSIQNSWTMRQTFNPDTLVLRGPGDQTVFINTQPNPPAGEGLEQEVLLPAPGTVIGGLSSINTVSQPLTNTPTATVTFSADQGAFGNAVVRTGGTFTIQRTGKYYVGVSLHVSQDKNDNLTRFWIIKNGLASIPYFGTTIDMKQQGDAASLNFQGYLDFVAGDQIIVRAKTSLLAGATLQALPASGDAPPVPGAVIQFVGYLNRGAVAP